MIHGARRQQPFIVLNVILSSILPRALLTMRSNPGYAECLCSSGHPHGMWIDESQSASVAADDKNVPKRRRPDEQASSIQNKPFTVTVDDRLGVSLHVARWSTCVTSANRGSHLRVRDIAWTISSRWFASEKSVLAERGTRNRSYLTSDNNCRRIRGRLSRGSSYKDQRVI